MAVVSSRVEWFFRACLLVAMIAVAWMALMQGQVVDLSRGQLFHVIVEIVLHQAGRMAGMDDLLANFAGLLIAAPLTCVIVHR